MITVEKSSVMLTVVEIWAKGYRVLGGSQLWKLVGLSLGGRHCWRHEVVV